MISSKQPDNTSHKSIKRRRIIVESDDSLTEMPNKSSEYVHNDINFEESDAEIPSKLPDLVHQPISNPTSEDKLLQNVTDTRTKDKFKDLSESNLVRFQCAKIEAGNILSRSNVNEKSSRSPDKLVTRYDPSKTDYHPIHDCNWREGESVPYLSLARTFECIEATSGRIKITEMLCNFFRSVGLLSSFDLTSCVYLCLNQLGPAYEGMELGVGETVLLKALAATTGVGIEHMRSSLKQHGDLGVVAEAQNKKVEIIRSLLVACRESETKYIIRSLSGKLRIGLAEQTVLTALGQAVAMTPFHFKVGDKSTRVVNASNGMSNEHWKVTMDTAVANVKRAYCVCPDYSRLIKALLTSSHESLDQICTITPGIPLKPMLASPTHGIYEILKRFEECDFTCEYKYDGERAQIHILPSGASHVYSRNQEDNTTKYPDIVNNLMSRVLPESKLTPHAIELLSEIVKDNKRQVQSNGIIGNKLESCIIDSEVVAWDRLAGHILPFQVLSTRKRKDVDESTLKVQICIYVFDILFINGVSLIEQPLRIRREILREVFPRISGEFMMATSLDSSDTDEIATFLDEAIKGNCEGLMIKTLDHNSTYEIAKRSHSWLKLKKDYLEGVGDTLDLVVIGGFHGTGKRAGRYGGYLLACYDPDTEEYQTICKIGTGMKDDELASFSEFFKNHVTDKAKPYYQYTISLIPDQWFEPVQVWEVKAADLSISPGHKAAAGLVYELYQSQEQIKNQHGNIQTGNNDDEDMY
ncbi:DNA ligase 1 [Schistosoma bovis]|uniref:DNA ligase n=1 Tax=Schistosoma bovis TaxID=6184 RepID=A0A430QDZ7_SCHBO|nr:DNA ligase 1 [Schistosoma bovis]